jgi:hypothetical protein
MEAKKVLRKKQLLVILTVLPITFFLGNTLGWTALVMAKNSGGQENISAAPAVLNPGRVQKMLLSQPLHFIPNQGQAPSEEKYQAVSDKNVVILTPKVVVTGMPAAGSAGRLQTLRLALVKPNPKGGLEN